MMADNKAIDQAFEAYEALSKTGDSETISKTLDMLILLSSERAENIDESSDYERGRKNEASNFGVIFRNLQKSMGE